MNLNFNEPQFQSTSTQHGCDIKATQSCNIRVYNWTVEQISEYQRVIRNMTLHWVFVAKIYVLTWGKYDDKCCKNWEKILHVIMYT